MGVPPIGNRPTLTRHIYPGMESEFQGFSVDGVLLSRKEIEIATRMMEAMIAAARQAPDELIDAAGNDSLNAAVAAEKITQERADDIWEVLFPGIYKEVESKLMGLACGPKKRPTLAGDIYPAIKEKLGELRVKGAPLTADEIEIVSEMLDAMIRAARKAPEDLIDVAGSDVLEAAIAGRDVLQDRADKIWEALFPVLYKKVEAKLMEGACPAESKFELTTESRSAMHRRAAIKDADETREPGNWGYTWDKWIKTHSPFIPDFKLMLDLGMQVETLGDERVKMGLPANPDSPITGVLGGGVELSWDRFRLDGYHLEPRLYYHGMGRGWSDAGFQTSTHRVGLGVAGLTLGDDYLPNFALNAEYYEHNTDTPNYPNPAERAFKLGVQATEKLYRGLSLDVGDSITVGEQNGASYLGNIFNVGLRFSQPAWMLRAGYRRLDDSTGTTLTTSATTEGAPTVVIPRRMADRSLSGNGAYLQGLADFGRSGTLDVLARYDAMDLYNDQAGVTARYALTRGIATHSFAFDYIMQNLNNGASHTATVTYAPNIAVSGQRDGYGVFVAPYISLGGQEITRDGQSESGFLGTLGARLTFGEGSRRSDAHDDLQDVAPTVLGRELRARQAEVVSYDDTAIFTDPVAATLLTPDHPLDPHTAASYLIAFKSGKLNKDYTLPKSGYPLMVVAAAKAVDGQTGSGSAGVGEYGYSLNPVETVSLGDVAPVAFFIGEQNADYDVVTATYENNVYRLTPSKARVLKLAAARHALSAQIDVAAPNRGSAIALELITALASLYNVPQFIDSLEYKAMTFGPDMMGWAQKALLHVATVANGNKEPSDAVKGKIAGLRTINRQLVDVIRAYAAQQMGETQELPTYGQLLEMLGATEEAAEPAPAVPNTADTIADAAERAKMEALNPPVTFANQREAIASGWLEQKTGETQWSPISGYIWVNSSGESLNFAVVQLADTDQEAQARVEAEAAGIPFFNKREAINRTYVVRGVDDPFEVTINDPYHYEYVVEDGINFAVKPKASMDVEASETSPDIVPAPQQ